MFRLPCPEGASIHPCGEVKMKNYFSIISIFSLFLFCCVPAAYSSMSMPQRIPGATVPIETLVPASVMEQLLDLGIDITGSKPLLFEMEGAALAISDSGDGSPSVVQAPGGQAMLCVGGEAPSVVRFTTAGDIISIQQVSVACITTISATLQALVSVIYNCGIVPNPLSCATSTISLMTNLYILPLVCEPTEE